jgi:tRNA (guanine37-N1)-methyltransferase
MKDLYLKVQKAAAEDARRRLIGVGVFDRSRVVLRERDLILLPVLRRVSFAGGVMSRRKSSSSKPKPRSLRESLRGRLSEAELKLLPSAFDVVGDIAILDVPDVLLKRKRAIGNALLRVFSNIRVVAIKVSPVSSEYRVRELKVIAGEKRTVTVHREYGCRYKLDVSMMYFSPRLGGERMRVASQVAVGERVLVMFAGVGPYAVLMARRSCPREVVSVELNPEAVGFMRENVGLNKVGGVVRVIEGDVRNVVPNLGKFDRIVMPLPKDAGDFLDVALPALKKGGIIHFYDFAESPKESAVKVESLCKKLGYNIKVLDAVPCGNYSPQLERVCVDFKVLSKNNNK